MLITQEVTLIAKTTSVTHDGQPRSQRGGVVSYGISVISFNILKLTSRALW